MKNIKVMKKEYTIIETAELKGLLADLKCYATMVRSNTLDAKVRNCNFAAGLDLETIDTLSVSAINYITEIQTELV